MRIKWIASYCIFLLCSLAVAAYASVESEGALNIMEKYKSLNEGWVDSDARLTMELVRKNGRSTQRRLSVKSLEVAADGDKSLLVFSVPADIKGTAFLSYSHILDADEQWMYLPAVKRVKRIASRNKSGPFMASEFAFEDMSSFEIEKYRFGSLSDNAVSGEAVYVVEAFPVDEFSGYSRLEFWIDKHDFQMKKTRYFDKRGELLKTLVLTGYVKYLDKFWRPDRQVMENIKTGKKTIITVENQRLNTGLNASSFTRNALMRAR